MGQNKITQVVLYAKIWLLSGMDSEQLQEIINYEIFVGIIQQRNDESEYYYYLFFLRNWVLPEPMTWLVFFC